jgi:hypothetical protein
MKVELDPKDNFRTTLPVNLEITEVGSKPKVVIKELGEIKVTKSFKNPGGFYAQFYASLPGDYTISIKTDKDAFTKSIHINQQEYLSFSKEFGAFFVLFLIFMTGIVLWTKKSMTKEI